jgi:peptidoglycan-associated lipoprotein
MNLKLTLAIAAFSVLTITNLKAQKNYGKEADAAFMNEQYFIAKDLYKTAAEKAKKPEQKAMYIFKVGECYRLLTDADQAETYYNRAIEGKYGDKDPMVYLWIAEVQQEQSKFKDAEKNYASYATKKADDPRGKKGVEACKLAQDWVKNPTRHIVENENVLNTEQYDFSPVLGDKKGSEMVFSSGRAGGTGTKIDDRTGEGYTDLWVTTRDKKGKFGEPTPLDIAINTEDNEGAACFDARMENMFFTRCPNEKKENLGCDIWMIEKKSKGWGEAKKLNLKPHDSLSVGHPCVSKDGKYLIFASDMPGGSGGKDLWMTSYDKKADSWSSPVNLGPKINTEGDEMYPFIHEDGSLYFASNGWPGMGGLDNFRAAKAGTEMKWDAPENLKFPLNSAQHDFGIMFEDKNRGYFSSNRKGGKGRDDLYSFMLPPLIFDLEITVLDINTNTPIPNAEIKLSGTNNELFSAKTDAAGKVMFATNGTARFINEESSYTAQLQDVASTLNAGKKDHQFTTVGVNVSTSFKHTFYLKLIDEKKPINLPMIIYEFDKADLMIDPTGTKKGNDSQKPVNSEDSLLILYNTLIDNPTLVITLRSHTDSRGNNKYNKELSLRRAQTCVNYLISKGINPARMEAYGAGEEELLVTDDYIKKNAKTKPEQELLHQKNRRTDFKIKSYDYKPTEEDKKLQKIEVKIGGK